MKMKRVLLLIVSFFLIFPDFSFTTDEFNAEEKAQSLQSLIESQLGNPESLQRNYIAPMLGNGTLFTLDRSKSFQASITCPSSQKFLEVFMQPKSSGDIDFRAYYDTNFDGSFDGSVVFSGVSGICADGFIRCDAGTWNNCKYYKVKFDGSQLLEEETSFTNLSSCFCVNNFCGNNLVWKNKNYILSTFGGMLVSAFQKYNPRFAVSQTQISDVVISYYGQDINSCTVVSGQGVNVNNQERYFDNPYQMSIDAQAQFSSSEFSTLFANLWENLEERVCYTRRVINEKKYDLTQVATSSAADNCPGISGASVCGENCLQFQMPIYISAGGVYKSSLNIDINPEFKEKLTKIQLRWCTQTTGPYPCTDDDGWFQIYLNGNLAASGGYGDSEDCGAAPAGGCWHNVNISISNLVEGKNTIEVRIGGAGGGEGVQRGCRVLWLDFLFNAPLKGCYITDNYIEDTCESLRKNQLCTLKDRIVDGVYVVQNGMNTGLQPLLSCQTICENIFCYNDWTIEEHYLCKTTLPELDFTRQQKNLETIQYGGSILSFSDIRKENGTWIDEGTKQFLISLQKEKGCPEVCKVKVIEDMPDVGEQGPISTKNTALPKVSYEYRECQNGACPYDPAKGEEMVQKCGCLTDFNDALVVLQAIRLAGQDIICTSGVKKTLPGW